jgi:cysteine desulfurase
MLKLPVYLDYNSTTPCDPRVVEAMLPYFTQKFGNAASRSHALGWEAEEAVELAREQVARLVGAEPKEIVFTSGATEGDNLAIKGVVEMYAAKGNHVITVVTEHKAVLDTCHHLEKSGGEVTWLPVDEDGLISLADLEAAIRPATVLIAVMYANNEIGVIQPIREISAIARRHGILFFTDATQAVGKIPVDVNADGIDLMAFSAHKLYGPKGIGALYVRRKGPRVRLTAQMDGGGHERGMRSGTLNVPAIVGFGMACELCTLEMDADGQRIAPLRDRLEQGLLTLEGGGIPDAGIGGSGIGGSGIGGSGIADAKVNGSRLYRLPQMTNISFPGVDGDALLAGLGKNVALSSGSACTSASMEPSYVLSALGLTDDLAHSSLRLGLGRYTTTEEVEYAIVQIGKTVAQLRANSPSKWA